jgi:hypothetical protein
MCELDKTNYPIYIKKTNHKYIIQYSTINQRWKIKVKSCQETSSYIACSEHMNDNQNFKKSDDGTYVRTSLPIDVKCWKVFDGGPYTSTLISAIIVTQISPARPERIDGVYIYIYIYIYIKVHVKVCRLINIYIFINV